MSKPAKMSAASLRKEYESVKQARKKTGKAAFGKPKTSKIHKEYKAIDRLYRQVGKKLGKATGLKPRR